MLLFFITFVLDNTPILQSVVANSTGFLMRQCQGECDSDSDCERGTFCFQRETRDSIPGCAGNPFENWDYCVSNSLTDVGAPTTEITTTASGNRQHKIYI